MLVQEGRHKLLYERTSTRLCLVYPRYANFEIVSSSQGGDPFPLKQVFAILARRSPLLSPYPPVRIVPSFSPFGRIYENQKYDCLSEQLHDYFKDNFKPRLRKAGLFFSRSPSPSSGFSSAKFASKDSQKPNDIDSRMHNRSGLLVSSCHLLFIFFSVIFVRSKTASRRMARDTRTTRERSENE